MRSAEDPDLWLDRLHGGDIGALGSLPARVKRLPFLRRDFLADGHVLFLQKENIGLAF